MSQLVALTLRLLFSLTPAAYANGAGKLRRAETAKTPADLAKPLKASAKATATWHACTDAMRRDFVLWIESAKQAETRERRIAQTLEKLAAGKKKMYSGPVGNPTCASVVSW